MRARANVSYSADNKMQRDVTVWDESLFANEESLVKTLEEDVAALENRMMDLGQQVSVSSTRNASPASHAAGGCLRSRRAWHCMWCSTGPVPAHGAWNRKSQIFQLGAAPPIIHTYSTVQPCNTAWFNLGLPVPAN
ncbi:hypothetical protein ABEF92_007546 [Exophiala dermatitidis]|uniref:Uncharacterized protein n=1 Tax=Exophiala dermatitidis (strain ATCC 34100 / CBS 525.76 / NIH/UT8656) TaxID=858893 RepID=H6BY46_EXODN|nr:uncharacterized protein HMPREF1120_05515 [Exophiala dermatitidis NIH/UT8656]EHY57482.1 hypothetical protein HMPREF1120_05515 [Exophiala dermatitidis NIH/UT8656]